MDIQDIAKVELLGTSEEAQAEGMQKVFYLKTKEGDKMYVPINEPLNRHYQAIRAWFNAQPTPPFEFNFPEPVEEADRGTFPEPFVPTEEATEDESLEELPTETEEE